MAAVSRLKVLVSLLETGILPLFYHPDIEIVARVVAACAEGGATCFEFTNRGDQAHEVFGKLVSRFKTDGQVILGAGSILEPATAALYLQLGAGFIVGPNFNPDVARLCNRRKAAYIPGCGSVSEISQAEELGAEICKVFPGEVVGGPSFIKDVLGPLPWARLMPTGGVEASRESIGRWIQAGAACLGMGSKLFPQPWIASQDYAAITNQVRQAIAWVKEARDGKPIL